MKKVVLALAVMAVVAGGAFAEFGGGLSAPSSDLRVAAFSEWTVTVVGTFNGKSVSKDMYITAVSQTKAKEDAIAMFLGFYPGATDVRAIACNPKYKSCVKS